VAPVEATRQLGASAVAVQVQTPRTYEVLTPQASQQRPVLVAVLGGSCEGALRPLLLRIRASILIEDDRLLRL
jgi:hypothetical protein